MASLWPYLSAPRLGAMLIRDSAGTCDVSPSQCVEDLGCIGNVTASK